MLCCGYTLTDFPISIRLTSLALWQSNDCPSASKATLMNMDKYFMWIHYERLHNHNKAKHNKTVCIFLGIYCILLISPSNTIVEFVLLSQKPLFRVDSAFRYPLVDKVIKMRASNTRGTLTFLFMANTCSDIYLHWVLFIQYIATLSLRERWWCNISFKNIQKQFIQTIFSIVS